MSRILFGTNRDPRPKKVPVTFGPALHTESSGTLRFGWATVDGRKVAIQVEPEKLVRGRLRSGLDEDESVLGSKAVFTAMRAEMIGQARDALVYLHGFNVTFKEGIRTAERLETILGVDAPLVALFSWPSDGTMSPWLSYASDRRDAAASGPAIGRAILKLADFLHSATPDESCEQRIHLLAHSMGTYVLRHALQTMITERPGVLPRLFDQIILVAADEDEDAFEHDFKLGRLPELARNVNVYFNRQDVAMAVSDRTKGNAPRLGEDGVRLPGQTPSRVTQVDCTRVVSGFFEHGYHLKADAVLSDIRAVLLGKEPGEVPDRVYLAERNCYQLTRRL